MDVANQCFESAPKDLDEFSLPSQDDLGLQKSNDDKKPAAVVKLDQYLKNHK